MSRVLAVLMLALVSVAASAQTYPSRPIKILVPSQAGGSVDKLARAVGKRLQDRWGQSVVIDNRGGAGGTIAGEACATAPPDGYTLLMGTVAGLSTVVSLEKIRYDPLKDFAPVTLVGLQDLVLVIAANSPANTMADVVQLARKNPNTFSYSSAGRGTGGHLSGELFSQNVGVPMLHIPYKGVAQAITDVIGGQVTITFASLATAQPLVQAKKVKPIAVTGRARSEVFPQVPTMDEAGAKGYESSTWYALVAPAGTPQAIIQRLNAEVTAMLKERETREQFSDEGIELVGSTPQELATFNRNEIEKWRKVIRSAGLDKTQ